MEMIFVVRKIKSSYWEGEEKATGKVLQTGSTKKEVVAKLIALGKNKNKVTILNEEGEVVKTLIRIASQKYSKA
jgi:hypothetical protein